MKKVKQPDTLELFMLVDQAKTIIDNFSTNGLGFPYELSTLLQAYAINRNIPYEPDTYGKVLELNRIMEHLKK